jgi:large subunit ribosomal protein L18
MLKVKRLNKHKKIAKRIRGTAEQPRLAVFRSTQHIYAQIIDDSASKTLAAESDLKLKGTKKERAAMVGENLAKKAIALKVKKVVFDRGGVLYHGRVQSLADGARKGGLEF